MKRFIIPLAAVLVATTVVILQVAEAKEALLAFVSYYRAVFGLVVVVPGVVGCVAVGLCYGRTKDSPEATES